VACRSIINKDSTFYVAKYKPSQIFIVDIQELIDQIIQDEWDDIPHKPTDLECWRLTIRN
jgi:hypothetical protein